MSEELYNEEEAYDEKISPLVNQIIEICRSHKIPFIMSFTYENDKELGRGRCTTHIPFEGRKDEVNERAHGIIRNGGNNIAAFAVSS